MPDDACPDCWSYAEESLARRPMKVGLHLVHRYRHFVGMYHGTHWLSLGARGVQGPHMPDPFRL